MSENYTPRLKTRGYDETEASLHNMVLAREEVLSSLVPA